MSAQDVMAILQIFVEIFQFGPSVAKGPSDATLRATLLALPNFFGFII